MSETVDDGERCKPSKKSCKEVIRGVDLNSGHMQPPLAKKTSLIQSIHASGYGRYSLDEIHQAITEAKSNGDLFQDEDDKGDVRLGINDAERLHEKIETNLSRVDEPRRDVIGIANKQIQKLRGDRDE